MKVHYTYIHVDSYMYTMTDEGPLYIYMIAICIRWLMKVHYTYIDSYMYTMTDEGPLYIYMIAICIR